MRHIGLSLLVTLMALVASAQTVTDCRPGELYCHVTDCSVSQLEVSGHIDARDFRFIADSLRHLTFLDLGSAVIDAYQGAALFGNITDYAAHEVPCMSLASMLDLRRLILPAGATRLGQGCLSGCTSLARLELPDSLTHIGDYAFSGCGQLNQLTVSPRLSHIGDGAFSNCQSLTSLTYTATENGTTIAASPTLHIGYRAFANCPRLVTVALGNSWTHVDDEAFVSSGLEQLDLSGQTRLDTIADWMLYDTRLVELKLPSQVRTIGAGALMNVAGIQELTLPSTVRYIGSYAMAYMTGLTELTSEPTTVPALGDSVWYGVNQRNVFLDVDRQSLSDYVAAPQWCNFMTQRYKRGDINGDGDVDVSDVNIAINLMLGKDNPDKYDGRAYVTDDDEIDVSDVNMVINIMLARIRAKRLAAERAARAAQLSAASVATSSPSSIAIKSADAGTALSH